MKRGIYVQTTIVELLFGIVSAFFEDAIRLNTSKIYSYRYLDEFDFSLRGSQYVTFFVKSASEAHIALSRFHDPHSYTYEVVIGDYGNSRTIIRDCTQCYPKVQLEHEPLDVSEFRGFWISWKRGVIRVGQGTTTDENELLIWRDPLPHEVNFIGISTGWGADAHGQWIFGHVIPDLDFVGLTAEPVEAPGAAGIGIGGIMFVAIVIVTIIVVDLPTLIAHFAMMRANIAFGVARLKRNLSGNGRHLTDSKRNRRDSKSSFCSTFRRSWNVMNGKRNSNKSMPIDKNNGTDLYSIIMPREPISERNSSFATRKVNNNAPHALEIDQNLSRSKYLTCNYEINTTMV